MRVWPVVALVFAVSAAGVLAAAALEQAWPLFLLFPGIALAIPLARREGF